MTGFQQRIDEPSVRTLDRDRHISWITEVAEPSD